MRLHQSRPWNPLIAQVLYRRGTIESWERGTLKMAELNRQAGLLSPEFESAAGEVLVRFLPTGYFFPMRKVAVMAAWMRGRLGEERLA